MSSCRYCGIEIEWQENNGKYKPLNLNNTPHNCKTNKQTQTSLTVNETQVLKALANLLIKEMAK